jgi:hypothetical protein
VFINPEFIDKNSRQNARNFANEIAVVVADHYPAILEYDLVIIKFTIEKGVGFKITSSQEYQFPVSKLVDDVNY